MKLLRRLAFLANTNHSFVHCDLKTRHTTLQNFQQRFVLSLSKLFKSLVPHNHLSLDRSPNTGPLIPCWELDKFKNCWNKSFRTCKILTLLYQQFSNLLISQRDMSGPKLGALSKNRWSGVSYPQALISSSYIKKFSTMKSSCLTIFESWCSRTWDEGNSRDQPA
jgi:hypothetical protein